MGKVHHEEWELRVKVRSWELTGEGGDRPRKHQRCTSINFKARDFDVHALYKKSHVRVADTGYQLHCVRCRATRTCGT